MSHCAIDWSELSLQVLVTLVHFLWQGCVAAILLFATERFLLFTTERCRRSTSSTTRFRDANAGYLLACIAFFSLPCCVLVTFAQVHDLRGPIVMETAKAIESRTAAQSSIRQLIAEPPGVSDVQRAARTSSAEDGVRRSELTPNFRRETETIVPFAETPTRPRTATWDNIVRASAPYLCMSYVIGVVLMLARVGLSIIGSSRLRRLFQPISDSGLLNIIASESARLGIRRIPFAALSQRVSVPVVVGIIRPVILLPPALMSGLNQGQLAAILSHELAHIRRYDPVINFLQRIVEAFLFFHPITWWISHRVRLEREHCCDDIAAASVGRLSYAAALLQMAELCVRHDGRRVAALASLSADGGSVSDFGYRIRRLIGAEELSRVGVTWRGFAAGVVLLSLLFASFVAMGQTPELAARQTPESVDERAIELAQREIFSPEPMWQRELAAEEVGSDMIRTSPLIIAMDRVLSLSQDFDLRTGDQIETPFTRLPRIDEFEATLEPILRRKSSDRKFIVEVLTRMPGKTFSMPSYDVRILRASDYQQIGSTITLDGIFDVHVCDADVENGGSFLLLGDRESVRIYRIETGQIESTLPVRVRRVDSVAFCPDLEWVVVSDQNDLHFWRWRDQAPVKTIHAGRTISSLLFTPDGQYLAEGPDTQADIQIRDMRTLRIVASLRDEVDSPLMVSSMDITPDGRFLVAHNEVSVDQKRLTIPHRIHVWNLRTRTPVFQIATGEWVRHVAFSDDGQLIVGEFSGVAHGAMIAAWKLPDALLHRQADVSNHIGDRLGDGVQWSRWGDHDGLLSGARLILPKNVSKAELQSGQLLQVEYRLANVSNETKTLKCFLNEGPVAGSLDGNHRITAEPLNWHREPVTLVIEPGGVFVDTEHIVSVDTTGLEPGEYHAAFGSAFHYPDAILTNVTHEIPHRGSIPFTISGDSIVKTHELPRNDIHWGQAAGGLQIGARFFGDSTEFADGSVVEADLFVANVTSRPLKISVLLPHPGDGWLFNVEDANGSTVMLERRTPIDFFSPQRYLHLQLAPGEVAPMTGDHLRVSLTQVQNEETFETSLLRVMFRIVHTDNGSDDSTVPPREPLTDEEDYRIQGRLSTSGGRYSAVFEVTLLRPEISGLRIALDTGNVPFSVVPPSLETGTLEGGISADGIVSTLPKLRVETPESPQLSMPATDDERKKYEASTPISNEDRVAAEHQNAQKELENAAEKIRAMAQLPPVQPEEELDSAIRTLEESPDTVNANRLAVQLANHRIDETTEQFEPARLIGLRILCNREQSSTLAYLQSLKDSKSEQESLRIDQLMKAVEGGRLRAPLRSPVSPPQVPKDRVHVATLFDRKIYLDELPEPRATQLLQIVSKRLTDNYRAREMLTLKEEWLESLNREVWKNVQSGPRNDYERELTDEERFAMSYAWRYASMQDWLLTKSLYEKYGGRVGMGSLGMWLAPDGRNALIREAIEAGNVRFHDPAIEQLFWKEANKENFADAYPKGDRLHQLLSQPLLR